ncbi:chitinase [Arthrobacter sp. FW305-BF8]|uniref:chitinase n=1 Tax=Arthrobacter sp. FW305-BF8 TaxID=2879617 RepID=UPI001F47C35C|nr:chitinase [Arthrobacter sp. FW305-BF8]UKA53484.1 chitinase [Arthrobacter sp. FW305-BF8]
MSGLKVLAVGATAAALVVLAFVLSGVTGKQVTGRQEEANKPSPGTGDASDHAWFGPYFDLTLDPAHRFAERPLHGQATTVLSFIVADPANPCEPSWGGLYDLEQANGKLDLDGQIERYRKDGNDVAVSFGGQLGTELANACTDTEALTRAYAAVITRYGLDVVDLDVEGGALPDSAAAERRATALARLQAGRGQGTPLKVWLTLPVSADGLTAEAEATVATMLRAGVDLAGVNIMTMNFGPLLVGQSMLDASISAANATHRQMTALYERAGRPIAPSLLWKKIGLTPMVGENDVSGQVLGVEDARGLNGFALERGVGRMSMWSLSRDKACTSSDSREVPSGPSPFCSGVKQENGMFAKVLGNGYAA